MSDSGNFGRYCIKYVCTFYKNKNDLIPKPDVPPENFLKKDNSQYFNNT